MADEKLLEKLAQDKVFIGKILGMPTPEDVQKAFKDKGADLSLAEVENFGKVLFATAENKGKLPDDALIASGGIKLEKWHKIAIAGITGVVAVGGATIAGIATYKNRDKIKAWFSKSHNSLVPTSSKTGSTVAEGIKDQVDFFNSQPPQNPT